MKKNPETSNANLNREKKVPAPIQAEWSWQLLVAVILSLSGLVLLFLGFYCHPTGEIHNSVLIGFGEVSTFAGALFGVDWKYKNQIKNQ